eukprot:TRINITY_DN10046_c0_g1_i1.p1 TRINITY_DN10046_c0_g1~~TRINITY_DN10046_c0_g1_i1.p1  ORF type:complete len:839 (+),score=166.03 TRINITY_DN10046_c0_g1_i1:44-2560(+)
MYVCWSGDNTRKQEDPRQNLQRQFKLTKQSPKSHRRVANACNFCKKLHLKCDGEKICANCVKRQLQCIYDLNKKRGPKEKSRAEVKPSSPQSPSSDVPSSIPSDEGHSEDFKNSEPKRIERSDSNENLATSQAKEPKAKKRFNITLINPNTLKKKTRQLDDARSDLCHLTSSKTSPLLTSASTPPLSSSTAISSLSTSSTTPSCTLSNYSHPRSQDWVWEKPDFSIPPHISHLSVKKLNKNMNPFAVFLSDESTPVFYPSQTQQASPPYDPRDMESFIDSFFSAFGYLYYWLVRDHFRQHIENIYLTKSKPRSLSLLAILANGSRAGGHTYLAELYFHQALELYHNYDRNINNSVYNDSNKNNETQHITIGSNQFGFEQSFETELDMALGLQLLGHYKFSTGQSKHAFLFYERANNLLLDLLSSHQSYCGQMMGNPGQSSSSYKKLLSFYRHNLADLILSSRSRESRLQLYLKATSLPTCEKISSSPENSPNPSNQSSHHQNISISSEDSAEDLYLHLAFAVGEIILADDHQWVISFEGGYLDRALHAAEHSLMCCKMNGGEQAEWGLLEMRNLLVQTLRAGSNCRSGFTSYALSCADKASSIVSSLISHRLLRFSGAGSFLALGFLTRIHSMTQNMWGLQAIWPGLLLAREYFPASMVEPLIRIAEQQIYGPSNCSVIDGTAKGFNEGHGVSGSNVVSNDNNNNSGYYPPVLSRDNSHEMLNENMGYPIHTQQKSILQEWHQPQSYHISPKTEKRNENENRQVRNRHDLHCGQCYYSSGDELNDPRGHTCNPITQPDTYYYWQDPSLDPYNHEISYVDDPYAREYDTSLPHDFNRVV